MLRHFGVAGVLLLTLSCASPLEHDLIIRNGTIVDGTGSPGYVGDLAIDGDRIAAMGDLIVRGSVVCRQTLLQERLLPLLERHLVDVRRDVVPEATARSQSGLQREARRIQEAVAAEMVTCRHYTTGVPTVRASA